MLQASMQWILRQKGWRAALAKVVLLTALWLLVTFVFATEIYLSMRGEPIHISWLDAAQGAFRDWFPWILLSPVALFLARKFRFGRKTWKRSFIAHFAACLLFTAAYEGLQTAASPGAVFLQAGGVAMVTAAAPMPPPLPSDFSNRIDVTSFNVRESNQLYFQRGVSFSDNPGPMSVVISSGHVVAGRGGPLQLPPPAGVRFPGSFQPSPWARFFHVAILRTQFTIPIYWCIVCICWAFGHFQESAERERRTLELETRLTQANLQALKIQLQPHFLFNTLNSISSLIHDNPKAADDMIGSLSQFLRTTLNVSAKDEIPLGAELEFLEHYLEIQQTRFGQRLKVCRDIDPGAAGALVPPLILQPLVENAIRHGIEPSEAGGTVAIRAARKNGCLHLEISDDGAGFSGGQLLRPGNGVGLSNTEARLQTLYGDKHQFTLTANQPMGASVKIDIPFRLSHSTQNGL
ncbi:MAG TPA: sensor histidine kinase [Verrucomicrobiae bacterium]|nr:sensor histidine kinase [Verrucomicrobiae bacterium]